MQCNRESGVAVGMCLCRDVFGCQNVMQGEFFFPRLNMLLSLNICQTSPSIFGINYRPRQSNSDFLGERSELLSDLPTGNNKILYIFLFLHQELIFN